MKCELFGKITAIDIETLTIMIRSAQHEDRIEAHFQAKSAAYFKRTVECYVTVHGEWLNDGSFNILRHV